MTYFEHHGGRLHYSERGRGEPLILIHGLGSSGADWALQAATLEEQFRLIAPDLPGSGQSDPLPAPARIEDMAAALWRLCDRLGVVRVNVVGFSLGGAVALEMALQRPEAVRRLGLINSLATYKLDHWRKWLEAALSLVLVPLIGMPRSARLAAKRLFPMPWQQSLRDRAVAAVSAVPATHYLDSGRALMHWSAVGRLDLLKAKTLMIAAENDFTPLAEKRALAACIGADLIVVRGSRHGTPFDAVRATNAALLALLNDQPLPSVERWICDPVEYWGPLPGDGTIAEEHAYGRMGSALRASSLPLSAGTAAAPLVS